MWPVVGVMCEEVGRTIRAFFKPRWTCSVEPWTTVPLVGAMIVITAGMLGRAPVAAGAVVGLPVELEPPPPPQPTARIATTDTAPRSLRAFDIECMCVILLSLAGSR